MPPKYFPLRCEGTGDQWWFASPIDWAAANGHYDLVRELIHIDNNLLFKLTSLARIRRLETVWDDDHDKSNDVAKCRSKVAQNLMRECETLKGYNSLIRAGHGSWLLYTAASAGDIVFVKELLDRDPLLVFGEREYGITDVLYAAGRSKNCEVFRAVFDCCLSATKGRQKEVPSDDFRWEMLNRAVHAAARGGNLEILRELLGDGSDVLAYRDDQGSTVLHTAAGRGQLEVVKTLISSYDIITSVDSRGNTSLNVAAYRGHLSTVEALISTSPSSASLTNNYGDTFLHMAVAGFCTPNFQRLDRQTHLMRRLVSGDLVNLDDIINVQNNDGRTPLHMAVTENIQSDIVELIMSVRYINLNIRDCGGNTPLDLLKQQPCTASSEILIRRLVSAGGFFSDGLDEKTKNTSVPNLRLHGIIGSPGTSFRIPDAEIVIHLGVEETHHPSCEFTSYSNEIEVTPSSTSVPNPSNYRTLDSTSRDSRRFKSFLRWLWKKKERDADGSDLQEDSLSFKSYTICSSSWSSPVPLRQQFSRISSFPNNRRILSLQGILPNPSRKKRFFTHDVRQVLPKSNLGSPCSAFSESSWSSPPSADKGKSTILDGVSPGPSSANLGNFKMKHKLGSFNLRSMNNYFCLGGQDLAVGNSFSSQSLCQNESSLVV
ncbi:hypothetical protein OROHE_022861 [Orobanche hederae]